MTKTYEQITYETRGTVALITLARPEKLNAWTPRMGLEQADAIARANADPAIGAIVMTGAGRGFCAGADMEATFKSRIDGTDPGGNTAAGQGGMPAGLDWVAMARAAKPLVAAVNGAAVGIGMTMILPSTSSSPPTRRSSACSSSRSGSFPSSRSALLVQRMGFGRASEMCLSGRLYSAAEAHQAGLVDVLTTADELVPKAFAIAESFAANPDPQLRMIKQLLTENGSATDLPAVQERESVLLRECWKSPEHKEAVAAFLEKRPPRFRG